VELHRGAGVVGAAAGVGAGQRIAEPDDGGVGDAEILEARQVLTQLAGGLGQAIVGRAYAREPASRLAAFNYAGVVFTYLLEVVLFRRVPAAHQVAGALIVIAAGILVSVLSARRGLAAADAPIEE